MEHQLELLAGLSRFMQACDLNDGVMIELGEVVYKDGSRKTLFIGDGLYVSTGDGTVEQLATYEEIRGINETND